MRSKRRLVAALAVALMCAPGTWLRSAVPTASDAPVAIAPVATAGSPTAGRWTRAGLWQATSPNPQFGGFSALLALDENSFVAFSDRGWRLAFSPPGASSPKPSRLTRLFPDPVVHHRFFDIEAAVRDPASGTIWLASENTHAIHRYTAAGAPSGQRDLSGLVDWMHNSGIEAMVRLDDGRFVILPEGQSHGLLFAGDPVLGGKPQRFRIRVPAKGFDITDAVVLPDGRLLVLMRQLLSPLGGPWPPFASLLAIGEVPRAGGEFAPTIALRLEALLPRENYEALALRPRRDGAIEVWIMADDNISALQRSLLARLVFTPEG